MLKRVRERYADFGPTLASEHLASEDGLRIPAAEADYHRRRPTSRQLEEVFWLEEERVVSEDWVVGYKNRVLQLQRQRKHWAPAKSPVLARENEAGEIAIHYRGQRLGFHELAPASTTLSEARGALPLPPRPPTPSPTPTRWRVLHPTCETSLATRLSAHENAAVFCGLVIDHTGDTSKKP